MDRKYKANGKGGEDPYILFFVMGKDRNPSSQNSVAQNFGENRLLLKQDKARGVKTIFNIYLFILR